MLALLVTKPTVTLCRIHHQCSLHLHTCTFKLISYSAIQINLHQPILFSSFQMRNVGVCNSFSIQVSCIVVPKSQKRRRRTGQYVCGVHHLLKRQLLCWGKVTKCSMKNLNASLSHHYKLTANYLHHGSHSFLFVINTHTQFLLKCPSCLKLSYTGPDAQWRIFQLQQDVTRLDSNHANHLSVALNHYLLPALQINVLYLTKQFGNLNTQLSRSFNTCIQS